MANELGLNEHHHGNVVNYLRFAKYQRGLHLKAIECCFQNTIDSRLLEETYTLDEVKEMLDGLSDIVKAEVTSELINTSYTTVLLIRQMCSQAEKWHLRLQADISELENRDLLEKIKEFEEQELSGIDKLKSNISIKASKLEPLVDDGGHIKHFKVEMDNLIEENRKLTNRLKEIEGRAFVILEEKSRLSENLHQTQSELRDMKDKQVDDIEQDIELLQDQMSRVKLEMEENKRQSSESQLALESDLVATKHHLLEVQAQLELAEKELEKKFSQTAAYSNMKKMLATKNEAIKDLRKRLSQYETVTDD